METGRGRKKRLPWRLSGGFTAAFLFLLPAILVPGCNTTDAPPEPVLPVIRIISPVQGQSYKSTDTVRIIAESDYARFSSGISFSVSLDSARNWTLIKSLVRKEGRTKDTLAWTAGVDLGAVPASLGLLVKVEDYSKAHSARSGYFFIAD